MKNQDLRKIVPSLLPLLSALLLAAPASGFDFTPKLEKISFADGSFIERPYFSDSGKSFILSVDHDTELSGNGGQALFRFRDLHGATLTLRDSPERLSFQGLEDSREDALKAGREIAAKFAPPGTTPDEKWEEQSDPLHLPKRSSYSFARVYRLPGSAIHQAVIFVNLDEKQQVILVLTALGPEFEKARERTIRIFRSWREVPKAEIKRPPIS